ncbi:MAG TPA: hypothetical protein VGO76_00520 [Luteibacter sp.]|jgi:hypothetical protein|nr:hypothetical protein [Luteibacter sp.]
MRLVWSLLLALLVAPVFAAPALDQLKLPPGSKIAVYTDQTPDTRELAVGAKGTVFVGSTGAGKAGAVYRVTYSK